MGIKKFMESLKEFGDEITSAADGVFDKFNETFDGLDTAHLSPEQEKEIEDKIGESVYQAGKKADDAGETFLGRVKRGLIFLERDTPKDDETEEEKD